MAALRLNMYSYLRDDGCAHKKAKGTKKWVMKHEIKLDDYKNVRKTIKKSWKHSKGSAVRHNVFNKKFNKIALSADDDQRIQMFHLVISYPNGTDGWNCMI